MIWKNFRIVAISLIISGLLQEFTMAEAAGCEDRRLHYLDWVQKYFELADAVFLGKVIEEETPPRPNRRPPLASEKDGASGMSELLEKIEAGQSSFSQPPRLQSVAFEVDKSWKGPASRDILVSASLYSDDTGSFPVFKKGRSYLVFAFESGVEETVHVPVACAVHESAAETASMIRVLDALTKKPGE